MVFDFEVFLNYLIFEVCQCYSWCDSVFYVLSFGLGGDLLDEC